MDTGWIINNIAAIIGAIIVLVVAYFVFRSKSNNYKSENDSKDSVPKVDRKNGAEESTSSPPESVNEKQTSPIWKTRRYVLNKIRSLKKPDILSEKPHEDRVQTGDNQEERLSPIVDTPVAELNQVPIETQEDLENTFTEKVLNEITPEISVPVTIDDTNTVSSRRKKNDVNKSTGNNDSLDIDMNDVQPNNETEETENTQLEAAVNNEQLSEKSERGSDIFSLFTEEDEEENEVSKFAANLDQVDVNKLLKDAEHIQKHIRR